MVTGLAICWLSNPGFEPGTFLSLTKYAYLTCANRAHMEIRETVLMCRLLWCDQKSFKQGCQWTCRRLAVRIKSLHVFWVLTSFSSISTAPWAFLGWISALYKSSYLIFVISLMVVELHTQILPVFICSARGCILYWVHRKQWCSEDPVSCYEKEQVFMQLVTSIIKSNTHAHTHTHTHTHTLTHTHTHTHTYREWTNC
jgi:hypothetical protein